MTLCEGANRSNMNVFDFETRYRDYLTRFGIAQANDRVVEIHDLDLEAVRFFGYSDSTLRLKAAVTTSGIVRTGAHADDDWYGFLTQMPTATAAAERIAWLETDESGSVHGLPKPPATVLSPFQPIAAGIDPAEWALITAPELVFESESRATFTAWILDDRNRCPCRWRIVAQPGLAAFLDHTPASDLLISLEGGRAIAVGEAALRARRILSSGTHEECEWALEHIGNISDREALGDIARLLTNQDASPDLKIQAAGTLARLKDPRAVAPLGDALREAVVPEVRRAAAQALSRIGGQEAVQNLWDGISDQPDVTVRAEIVHALTAQGYIARIPLLKIATNYPDAKIRQLARESVDSISKKR